MSALTSFHTDIKNILEQARSQARSAVNAAMVEAYWLIGLLYLTFPDQAILSTLCRELITEIEREKRLIEGTK
ncbi:hypothetical protein VT99_10753 [Candidatus Electrothrix marina]|uniref:YhcG N-terminal domain-containing protein n=1 Tax=Candidatus Electrothrix marina TaxID=1859130 RepID=A0A444J6A8_9BACT|nr:hypothetical protein VT99_10753 [Candidatus Electrothrix marina]